MFYVARDWCSHALETTLCFFYRTSETPICAKQALLSFPLPAAAGIWPLATRRLLACTRRLERSLITCIGLVSGCTRSFRGAPPPPSCETCRQTTRHDRPRINLFLFLANQNEGNIYLHFVFPNLCQYHFKGTPSLPPPHPPTTPNGTQTKAWIKTFFEKIGISSTY